jgi:DNA-binding MarR family transcriptional regulator
MNNIDYYVLCVLEMTPRFNKGEPFNMKEIAYFTDLDKSEVSKSLKILKEMEFITLLTDKPKTYSFNLEKFEDGVD